MKILKRNVSKQELKDFLYEKIDLEDKELYNTINKSQANIFQFSAGTASGMVQKAQPRNFNSLIAINCLSRPGSSFQFDDYVANGENYSKYPKFIADHLKDTHGCILTQEQIMAISTECGINANMVRGLLKKLGKANKKQEDIDKWSKVVEQFKIAFKEKGMTDGEIKMVLDDFVTLSSYSFNKSHAACYSAIACMTLYMMTYFKSYYWASSLTYDASKLDVLKDSIKNANQDGFKILPPDINNSDKHFTPFEKSIAFGLNDIKGVGEQPAIDIIANRPYSSPIEFITKNIGNSINKRVTTALINSGAMDSIIGGEENRKYYSDVFERFYTKKKTTKTIPLLEEKWEESLSEIEKTNTTGEWLMEMENQYLGGMFWHNRFSIIDDKIETLYRKGYCLRDFQEIREKNLPKQYCFVYLTGWRVIQDKKGRDMAMAYIEDRNGEKQSVPFFFTIYPYVSKKYFGDGFYLLDLYATEDGKMMPGSRNWIRDEKTLLNLMAKVPGI